MIEIVAEFKDRLDEAMARKDMKPVELSKLTGISEQTISQYRSGYSKPKKERLALIANILGVNPTWLMGLNVDMFPMPEIKKLPVPEIMSPEDKKARLELQMRADEYYNKFARLSEESRKAILDMVDLLYEKERKQ